MKPSRDTIAAVATPPGRGALSIVRLSGPDSVKISAECLRPQNVFEMASPGVQLRFNLEDPSDRTTIDEVMAVKNLAPRSFTGEDTVEITLHGGRAVTSRCLSTMISLGARPADPGEFTMRAFLNGKMDLAQAEAVAQIIAADSRAQLRCASWALTGGLSTAIEAIYEPLAGVLAEMEAAIEFPDDRMEDSGNETLLEQIGTATERLRRLAATFNEGRLLSKGASVVISGRPNAGKSSLFNALAGAERAIVTDIPGTTRDFLECHLDWDGFPVRLYDTAGIREPVDSIERIGVSKTMELLDRADAVIYVIDASAPISPDDAVTIGPLAGKAVTILNKSDLVENIRLVSTGTAVVLECSAKYGKGVSRVRNAVLELLALSDTGQAVITNARHHSHLLKALSYLENAAAIFQSGEKEDLAVFEIQWALRSLGAITGTEVTEDVLKRIFSTFCIGK